MNRDVYQMEPTAQGGQTLVPGIRPITVHDRLQVLANMPLRPRKAQKPLDIGLFDEDRRNQLELF